MKKNRTIVFIIIAIVLMIVLINSYNKRSRYVEAPLTNDTIYIEEIKRDSIKSEIDSIVLSINKNNKYEKEFYEAVSDSDSMSIVRKFIQLCTE